MFFLLVFSGFKQFFERAFGGVFACLNDGCLSWSVGVLSDMEG